MASVLCMFIKQKSHFLIRQSTLYHFLPFKMWYLFVSPSLALTYNIYLSSSSSTNLAITTWLLVFHVFIFRVYLTLVKAVTLILKHATFLCTSKSPKSALTNAEQKYQKANIDVTIQQHLTACDAEQSFEQFVGFIMSTDISLFIFFHLSHQYLIILSVSSQSSAHTGA
jgi:hypothetical protein